MVHLAWERHQPRQGRKTPLYGVEKGHRRLEPVAKKQPSCTFQKSP